MGHTATQEAQKGGRKDGGRGRGEMGHTATQGARSTEGGKEREGEGAEGEGAEGEGRWVIPPRKVQEAREEGLKDRRDEGVERCCGGGKGECGKGGGQRN